MLQPNIYRSVLKQNIEDAVLRDRGVGRGDNSADYDAINALLEEGLTQKQAAKRMNCCVRTVQRAKAHKAA